MQSAARINDAHACSDSGPNSGATLLIEQGSPNILINGKPAARVGDSVSCRMSSSPTTITTGAKNVLFNGKPAARMGDTIANGGSIIQGSSNVFIGDGECLISIGEGVQVEFGDTCMVYLNCGSDAGSSPTPSIAQPESHLFEKMVGIALMAGGIPLDEVGVGEGMQAEGAELFAAGETAEKAAAETASEVTAKESVTAEASTVEKTATEESSAAKTAEKPEIKGPTAGNTVKKQCGSSSGVKKSSLKKMDQNYLKKKGIDAHAFKKDILGKDAKISSWDINIDASTDQVLLISKNGDILPTEYTFEDLQNNFILKK